jgi:glycosyltransferase involved in cell wall biosynthesis
MERRPKLLFLAWYFPPVIGVPCARTWSMSKYLARLGWSVTVVTPHPFLWRHTENATDLERNLRIEGIQQILTGHRGRYLISELIKCNHNGPIGTLFEKVSRRMAALAGIDNCIGWVKSAEQACATLSPRDVDVILATGSPFCAFTLAQRLAKRLNRPYVLDYRDSWTENPHSERAARPSMVQQEALLLANCSAMTVVSPSLGSLLDQRFGLGTKMNIVTNGYDPDDVSHIKPHQFDHRALVYTGKFYPPKRVISPVMAALKHLKESDADRGCEWYFHYYGGEENHVNEEARRYGVTDRVISHGRVSRAIALSATRGASLALVITSVGKNGTLADRGIVTGKVFEALGLGTPILLIAPPGNDAATIVESSGMGQRVTGTDISGITHFLMSWAPNGFEPQKACDSYSWPALAGKLDSILRHVIDGNSTLIKPAINRQSFAESVPRAAS